MLRLRPYNKNDAKIIMSWIKDETSFYKWTAGVLGEYPISVEQFRSEERRVGKECRSRWSPYH